MLVNIGVWIAAAGLIALSLECIGAAVCLFGAAALVIRHAS